MFPKEMLDMIARDEKRCEKRCDDNHKTDARKADDRKANDRKADDDDDETTDDDMPPLEEAFGAVDPKQCAK